MKLSVWIFFLFVERISELNVTLLDIYGGHLVTEDAKLSWSHIYMDFVNTIYDDWNNIIE